MSLRIPQEIAAVLADAGLPEPLEIVEDREETRLKFNAPTPVRVVVVRSGSREAELFHWLVDDEWEVLGFTP